MFEDILGEEKEKITLQELMEEFEESEYDKVIGEVPPLPKKFHYPKRIISGNKKPNKSNQRGKKPRFGGYNPFITRPFYI